MKNIAINGFGRIGRLALRQLYGSEEYKVVAINDRSTNEENAYLLKYDTMHRTFEEDFISFNEEGIVIDGETIKCFNIDDPKNYPWGQLNVDCVLECTGAFTSLEKAQIHIEAGAKHVIISAPGKGDMKTIVYGVNENILTGDELIISAASCTTNALAPLLKVVSDHMGIEYGYMTTIHAYTNDQATMDGAHSKGINSRRGRACAENVVPASTGAASAIGEVLPELKGKLDGMAFRIPVADGSCIDLTLILKKETTKDEINSLLDLNSNQIIKYTLDPIVSSDVIGTTCACIVDGQLTNVLEENKKMVKLVAWYDNEYGYTAQMLKTMETLLR